jgi:sarcosine oxidase
MDRREFLHRSGAALGAVSLASTPLNAMASPTTADTTSPQVSPAAVRTGAAPEVVVVGAGAFGGWTAWALRRQGVDVTLVDAYGPGNPRATSGGDTRQIRPGYGAREMYTRWAVRALEEWRRLEAEWGEPLLIPTGRLSVAPAETDSMRAAREILTRLNIPNEMLGPDEVGYRWPQFGLDGIGAAHFEPTAAVIRAARAMQVVAREFERAGGELRIARALPGSRDGARLVDLELTGTGTERLSARTFVFALGPWLPRTFPDVLGGRIAFPRRDVFHFGSPAGDERFSWPNLPNFSESTFYGFPSIDFRGIKICPVGGNVPFDPDVDERIVASYQVKRAHDYIARRFPALRGQPIIESRVCQLEDTPDEHFIIDRHPAWENVWIAGGGTGHGFKHGPVVGEYIADRVMNKTTDPEYDRAFSLARFGA